MQPTPTFHTITSLPSRAYVTKIGAKVLQKAGFNNHSENWTFLMPFNPSQMAQHLTMLMAVADKRNPLGEKMSPVAGTEGSQGYSGGRGAPGIYGPYGPPKGQETYNDQFRVFTKESPWEAPPKVSGPVFKPGELESLRRSSARTESDAAGRGAKFDKRVETLETGDGYFVTLKPGYKIPGQGGSFGADSLKEVREMMKSVIKDK
jgi:hypothetical protein